MALLTPFPLIWSARCSRALRREPKHPYQVEDRPGCFSDRSRFGPRYFGDCPHSQRPGCKTGRIFQRSRQKLAAAEYGFERDDRALGWHYLGCSVNLGFRAGWPGCFWGARAERDLANSRCRFCFCVVAAAYSFLARVVGRGSSD